MIYLLKVILVFSSLLSVVAAESFVYSPNHIIVGSLRAVTAQSDDTFVALSQQFSLGYEEMVVANPELDAWVPEEGSTIVLPGRFILPQPQHKSIYINLAEMRIYYYAEQSTQNLVYTYPISIGRGDWLTPQVDTKIINKIVEPTWYPPESVRKEHALEGEILPMSVPPGKDNPLGRYALQLDLPSYFIHGTNRPEGIGMRVTHGCIRLRPNDIEILFNNAQRETPVAIQYQPFKVAVENNIAYLESHGGGNPQVLADYLDEAIVALSRLLDGKPIAIDWEKFIRVAKEGRGIPTIVNLGEYPLDFVKVERLKSRETKKTDYIF